MSNGTEAVAWTREIGPSTCLASTSWAEPACPFTSALQSFIIQSDAGETSDKKGHDADGVWTGTSLLSPTLLNIDITTS